MPRAVPIGRAPRAPLATSPLPWLSGSRSLGRCARAGTHHSSPSTQGRRGPGERRPLHAREWDVLQPQQGAGPQQLIAAPPPPKPTYRLPARCARVPGVGCLVHLLQCRPGVRAVRRSLRRARGEARRELGGLASTPPGGRLHLLSESLSHVCGRCSCRGGSGAGLGAIIWEDAVPCPARRGGISLKEVGASLFLGRSRPAPREEEGAAVPAPDCGCSRTSCSAAASAGS